MLRKRNIKSSIFVKYFTICAGLTVSCLTVLSILLITFSTQYFNEDKYDLLKTNVQKAAKYTENQLAQSDSMYLSGKNIESFYGLLADAIDSNVFLTNSVGKVIYCTEARPCVHTTFTVSESIIEKTKSGEYRETGDFNGVYDEKCYSVGVPVHFSNEIVGYIYASMPAKQMTVFFKDLFRLLLVCEIIVLAITFILVYFITRQFSQPLQNMSVVAQKIGKGDFSLRIPVTSDDEIGELAKSLNKMSDSLSTLENSRRSFVANVSHELKTPMTSIGGFIDGILDGTIPPDKQDYYLKIVSDEVNRLSRLVRSMLNLSKIEAGETKIQYSDFNIVDTMCDSVFSFEKSIEAKNLFIEGLDRDKLIIKADRDMIHQVIYNLTENAVKFANENGYISYDCKAQNNMAYISIRNSGDGLTKEEITHIFDRFYKTDKSRGLDKTGVGLGLNIVQMIVKLHGGQISVKSVLGEYTEFTVALPVSPAQPPSSHQGGKDKPPRNKLKKI